MAKEDIKSAFRNIPMQFSNLNLLGICVQGQYFIDCALPFGASISCAIFEQVATLIHWIAEKHAGHKMVHYLDDFFTVHQYASVCRSIMSTFMDICEQIAMPIALDKSEGPATVIEFLGLTTDSNLMVVHIPQDKLNDIFIILTKMIHSRKATSWELQSLVGKLNFITKAIPVGRSFTKRIYQAFTGIPNHRHIDLRRQVLSDLHMWKVFLQCFRGWAPIIHTRELHSHAVELFADAARNPHLGWGAWLPHKVSGCMEHEKKNFSNSFTHP